MFKKVVFYLSDKRHIPEHPLGLLESKEKEVGKSRPWQGADDILQVLLKDWLAGAGPAPGDAAAGTDRIIWQVEFSQQNSKTYANKKWP